MFQNPRVGALLLELGLDLALRAKIRPDFMCPLIPCIRLEIPWATKNVSTSDGCPKRAGATREHLEYTSVACGAVVASGNY